MKIGNKKFVLTISAMSVIGGKMLILSEEIINCVFQCKMHGGCIGFHNKFIRLFLRDDFAPCIGDIISFL